MAPQADRLGTPGAVLHSLHEVRELLQWQQHHKVNIVMLSIRDT